jgi:hypothetical protein
MIKEAMEYLLTKVTNEVRAIEGNHFHITAAGAKIIDMPARETVTSFSVRTLTGLVDYINSEADKAEYSTDKLFLQVASHNRVVLFSTLKDRERDFYISAEAQTPQIKFDSFMDTENFNIMLQSCFQKNEDLEKMLAVVGTIKEENVKTTGDNGITQSVTAKAGIARYDEVELPNPVTLTPFRTFTEIFQPSSSFVFRMQNGPRAALFEADAGAWKLRAMQGIKMYLKDHIKVENIEILA